MKNYFTLAAVLILCVPLFAQNMVVKKFNTTTFKPDVRATSELLWQKSSEAAKQHPEFGILPYNSQCAECVELIDKRTIDTRFFINPKDEGHSFSQKSFFPMHYQKQANDIWRTIDPRLREKTPGVYVAENQPVPTKCDLNRQSTSLTEHGFEFEFNKNLTMYFFDDNSLYTAKETGNYTNHTIGEEGLYVKNMWAGIDMEQSFTPGQIKTNYIIAAPLQLPVSHGWMVIEDHFTLPAGLSIVETGTDHLQDGLYRGSYAIKNEKGETLITYEKPVYIDAKVLGMAGVYKLLQNGNNYTLQTYVPVEWLNKTDNTYPLLVDPNVYGATKVGDFTQSGLPSASMGFTSINIGSCDYHITVTAPGKSEIINTYVDVEYTLTYDNTCGTPALPPPYCTINMVSMEVVCDSCQTSTGPLNCSNPASGPQAGTCTTDSNLVPGAHAIQSATLVPSTCYTPQCPDYDIDFTLRNRDSICGDVCGYLCARGNMWRTTVEARQVSGNITASNFAVCAGDSVVLTAHPEGGVPPYHYDWFYNLGDSVVTIYSNPDFVFRPKHNEIVACNIIDACGIDSFTNDIAISFYPGTTITVSGDTLISTQANTYQWYLNDSLIAGANGRTFIASTAGYYYVLTDDTSGTCPNLQSNTISYLIGPNGLDEVNQQIAGIKLYPNPATNELNIYSNGLPVEQVKLFSTDARLVAETKKGINKIDISHLAKGAYIAEVILKKGAKKIRWVKL